MLLSRQRKERRSRVDIGSRKCDELRAHQMLCNMSTEMERVREHHQIRHEKEIEVVRELEMQLSEQRRKREVELRT